MFKKIWEWFVNLFVGKPKDIPTPEERLSTGQPSWNKNVKAPTKKPNNRVKKRSPHVIDPVPAQTFDEFLAGVGYDPAKDADKWGRTKAEIARDMILYGPPVAEYEDRVQIKLEAERYLEEIYPTVQRDGHGMKEE